VKKIAGILGGLGPQSTELFYRILMQCCQHRDKIEYPHILINSIETFRFIELLDANKEDMLDFMKGELDRIQDRVDFVAIVCNTAHYVFDELKAYASVPLMGIHEEVCKTIAKTPVKKVGLLGTRITVQQPFYMNEFNRIGVPCEVLDFKEENKLHKIILSKMLYGDAYDELRRLLIRDVVYLENKGCDGVALACTELPLFISQKHTNVRLFSSTGILAQAVVNKIFEEEDSQKSSRKGEYSA
jgi:aspartate racemase